jgi:hypothetical protein
MGVLQLLDADETTVLFDLPRPNRAANSGTVPTKLGPALDLGSIEPTSGRSARRLYYDREDAALVTERVDSSQQRESLEAGAVSELQGIARFKVQSRSDTRTRSGNAQRVQRSCTS